MIETGDSMSPRAALWAALGQARRVWTIKRKIQRLGRGPYKPGGSSKPGHLYSPIPFPAFHDVPSQREACVERFDLIRQHVPAGLEVGRLLDIGCGTGFNSFKFAELGWDSVGIDIDPECIDIAVDLADLYKVRAQFRCEEATPDGIRRLGRFQVALFLSSFQWVTDARGFDFAREVLRAAQEQSDVLFFETSMGTEGRAKMPMFPDRETVEQFLIESGLHDEVRCLGEVPAPNVWLQKSRCVFRTRRTS